jgi:hypothetical protein
MENQLKQAGIGQKFVGSIPVAGPALGIWLEHRQMGIAQYGRFLGLVRGAVVRLILCIGLIVVSEAFILHSRWGGLNSPCGIDTL